MEPESPWSAPELLSAIAPEDGQPALATIGTTPHLVWSKDDVLFHTYRTATGWAIPARIAMGSQPALVSHAGETLHCLFSYHQSAGKAEIYHVSWDGNAWSLPVKVSNTSGTSSNPALAIGPDGDLHAVWADTTPGISVIYYGRQETPFLWSNVVISQGPGDMPSIAMTGTRAVCVAWQDRLSSSGKFDIFCSLLREGTWEIPEDVSDSEEVHSLSPRLSALAPDECHVIWREQQADIYHIYDSDSRPEGWSTPCEVSGEQEDCSACALTNSIHNLLQVVWVAGSAIKHRVRPAGHDKAWQNPEIAYDNLPTPTALTFAGDSKGQAHLVWAQADFLTDRNFYYSVREPLLKHTVVLPIIMQ